MVDIAEVCAIATKYGCRNEGQDPYKDALYRKLVLHLLCGLNENSVTTAEGVATVTRQIAFDSAETTVAGASRLVFIADMAGGTVDGVVLIPNIPLVIEAVNDTPTGTYKRLPAIDFVSTAGASVTVTEVV